MRGSVGSTLHKSKLSLQPLIDLIEPTPKNKVKDLQVLQQLQWTAHCGHSLSLSHIKNYGWCDIESVHTHGACLWFAPLLPVRDYQDLPRMFHLKNISWIRIHM